MTWTDPEELIRRPDQDQNGKCGRYACKWIAYETPGGDIVRFMEWDQSRLKKLTPHTIHEKIGGKVELGENNDSRRIDAISERIDRRDSNTRKARPY